MLFFYVVGVTLLLLLVGELYCSGPGSPARVRPAPFVCGLNLSCWFEFQILLILNGMGCYHALTVSIAESVLSVRYTVTRTCECDIYLLGIYIC